MASPSLVSQGFSASAGVTDPTFTPTLTAHVAGDMLELDVGVDGNPTVSFSTGGQNGWTLNWQLQNTTGSTTPTMAKLSKLATSSSETPPDLEATAGEAWAASCRVYRGSGGTLNYYSPTPVNGTDSGSGADGQGSAVNPGVGSQDFTFTQCMVMDGVQGTNAAPSGYGNYQTNNNPTAARVDISTAELAATATGDTPGAWDSNAEQWIVGGGAVWETSGGTTHAASGALVGQGSVIVGSAARTRIHPSSGDLTGPGSAIAGAANRARVHPSSGDLVGPGSVLSGSAARTRVHPTSGALTGQGSVLVGQTDHQGAAGTHDTTGALVGPGSALAGTAARFRAFATSGDLIGPGAVLTGSAARVGPAVTHDTFGNLVGPGSDISGQAQNGVVPDTPFGGGFFSYAWRRKLMEDELREQLKELPDPVAEVIERQVIEAVDRPKLPSQKELRAKLEQENIPYRQAYQKAMVSLVKEMRQREADDEEEEAIAFALASLV